MNCEEEIKKLEEEVASTAQDLLSRKIEWNKRELEYLLDASLGMPKPHYIGSLYRFSLCIINLCEAKKASESKAKKEYIKYAIYWLGNFKYQDTKQKA